MNWWQVFAYLGMLVSILARAKALFPGRPVRTLIVVEDPARPLSAEEAQGLLASTGAVVIKGFSITP